MVYYLLPISAGVVELVDTLDSKSNVLLNMSVRVRPPVPSPLREECELIVLDNPSKKEQVTDWQWLFQAYRLLRHEA